ncbi:unnamed protein product [Prorocentrum cordatum]|uniref:Uncharacterized protein n=1 Tax=Prorocentrum cordatum TaxID=2364126 RepID=A0ABN9PL03_9DINO|nr:unnamed protein product [Polarella glacialis]
MVPTGGAWPALALAVRAASTAADAPPAAAADGALAAGQLAAAAITLVRSLRPPKWCAVIQANGQVRVSTTLPDEEARIAAKKAARLLQQRYSANVGFKRYRVENVQVMCALPFNVDVEQLSATCQPGAARAIPIGGLRVEQSDGQEALVLVEGHDVGVRVHRRGSMVVTKASSFEQAAEAMKAVVPALSRYGVGSLGALGFPRDWPAVYSSSRALKSLVGKKGRCAGQRVSVVGAPDADDRARVAGLRLRPLQSFANARENFVAERYWWNRTADGSRWLDFTPRPAAQSSLLLVQSAAGAAKTPSASSAPDERLEAQLRRARGFDGEAEGPCEAAGVPCGAPAGDAAAAGAPAPVADSEELRALRAELERVTAEADEACAALRRHLGRGPSPARTGPASGLRVGALVGVRGPGPPAEQAASGEECGPRGVATSWDADRGRWLVRLRTGELRAVAASRLELVDGAEESPQLTTFGCELSGGLPPEAGGAPYQLWPLVYSGLIRVRVPDGLLARLNAQLNLSQHRLPEGQGCGRRDGAAAASTTSFFWKADAGAGPESLDCPGSLECELAEGYLYVFPQWLQHHVWPFRGPGERRTLAGNIALLDHADACRVAQARSRAQGARGRQAVGQPAGTHWELEEGDDGKCSLHMAAFALTTRKNFEHQASMRASGCLRVGPWEARLILHFASVPGTLLRYVSGCSNLFLGCGLQMRWQQQKYMFVKINTECVHLITPAVVGNTRFAAGSSARLQRGPPQALTCTKSPSHAPNFRQNHFGGSRVGRK